MPSLHLEECSVLNIASNPIDPTALAAQHPYLCFIGFVVWCVTRNFRFATKLKPGSTTNTPKISSL
jgi:hypothetical protein